MPRPYRITMIAGARPNFMKVAPIAARLRARPDLFDTSLVHTGQHYDNRLSAVFFDDLGIPRPDVNLNVGAGSQTRQMAAIMTAFEPVLTAARADLVLVVGDVTSTIACALVATRLGVPVAHVEAGLRSFDRTMPEEVNRVLTDQLAQWLFTTEAAAAENLYREGVAPEKVHFVGNVMIDTLLTHRARARALGVASRLGLRPHGYALLTLHRPSNVDDPVTFEQLVEALSAIASEIPLVFPVHPRTRAVVEQSPAAAALVAAGRVRLLEPLGYLEFVGLMETAALVLTDSGGIQEETTILGVPCLTLRENTERPVTVTHGTNQIVGTDPARILDAWRAVRTRGPRPMAPALWDGRSAARIVDVLQAVAARRDSGGTSHNSHLPPRLSPVQPSMCDAAARPYLAVE